jgi:uncharacterized protein (TIGR03086 family)
MPESIPDLAAAAAQVEALIDGVRDGHLEARTPCEDYTVGDILDHMMGLTLAFRVAAEKADGPITDSAPAPDAADLDPQWRSELPKRLDALVAAWRDPAAWQGETKAGGVTLPAEVMGLVAMDELVIHGWDLARATGQPYALDPATADAVLVFLEQGAEDTGGQGTPGMFGPVVQVPPTAPALDRAVGLAGRDPAWRP